MEGPKYLFKSTFVNNGASYNQWLGLQNEWMLHPLQLTHKFFLIFLAFTLSCYKTSL